MSRPSGRSRTSSRSTASSPRRKTGQASRKRARRRKSRTRRILALSAIGVLCMAAFVLIGGGSYILFMLGRVNFVKPGSASYDYSQEGEDIDYNDSSVVVDDPVNINDLAQSVSDIALQGNTKVVTNILLLGIDSNAETDSAKRKDNSYTGRADSMIILSINKYKKTIKMISLLRDTYVTIPGHTERDKLNSAYSRGGFDLLSKTIETNFRLKIDDFIAVNFVSFAKLVEAMDGIDVTMTAAEAKTIHIGTAQGTYHLNGDTALHYSRIRNIGDDFGRTSRQRTAINAMLVKAKTMKKTEMLGFLNTALEMVYTNMGKTEFLGYVLSASSYLSYETDEYSIPMRGKYDDPSVLIPGTKKYMRVLLLLDPKATVLDLHHMIYG